MGNIKRRKPTRKCVITVSHKFRRRQELWNSEEHAEPRCFHRQKPTKSYFKKKKKTPEQWFPLSFFTLLNIKVNGLSGILGFLFGGRTEMGALNRYLESCCSSWSFFPCTRKIRQPHERFQGPFFNRTRRPKENRKIPNRVKKKDGEGYLITDQGIISVVGGGIAGVGV